MVCTKYVVVDTQRGVAPSVACLSLTFACLEHMHTTLFSYPKSPTDPLKGHTGQLAPFGGHSADITNHDNDKRLMRYRVSVSKE